MHDKAAAYCKALAATIHPRATRAAACAYIPFRAVAGRDRDYAPPAAGAPRTPHAIIDNDTQPDRTRPRVRVPGGGWYQWCRC